MAVQFLEAVSYDEARRLVSIDACVDGETVKVSTSVKVLEQAYGLVASGSMYIEEYFRRIARNDIESRARARLEDGERNVQFARLRDVLDSRRSNPRVGKLPTPTA